MENNLLKSFRSTQRVEGLTHNFYRYPARFSPEFAREVIEAYSEEGDYVLDAFMGGGTSIVEAIARGRKAIGIDINPLSHFIVSAKTTPLSCRDQEKILLWVKGLESDGSFPDYSPINDSCMRNVPEEIKAFFFHATSSVGQLDFPRQRRFARCALLKVGQWAIDCRRNIPDVNQIQKQLSEQIIVMLEGLNSLVKSAKDFRMPKNKITGTRILHLGTVNSATQHMNFANLSSKPKLVLTSPPYPGVHVLYHRWQVTGRCETPAPYWLANLRDGHGESFYTLGGRSRKGLENYFIKLTETFRILRQLIDPNALVVQLVAFYNPADQLPVFLQAMNQAGYEELIPFEDSTSQRPLRKVPNRKWYTQLNQNQHSSNEVLLFHRPCS